MFLTYNDACTFVMMPGVAEAYRSHPTLSQVSKEATAVRNLFYLSAVCIIFSGYSLCSNIEIMDRRWAQISLFTGIITLLLARCGIHSTAQRVQYISLRNRLSS